MKFVKIDLENYVKPSKFLKLIEGENRIRILTDGYIYRVVGKKTARGFVRAIVGDKDIPTFLQDAEPKLTYGFVVYSLDSQHFHVLECGPTLGDQLVKLLQQKPDKQYQTVDVLIKRKGKMLDTVYEASYAKESSQLPDGANKENTEFKIMLKHFSEEDNNG